jgi:hypothetical protein
MLAKRLRFQCGGGGSEFNLLDEAISLIHHMFWFFCFQSDAIKDLKLYKAEFQLATEELLLF